jgi:hypothetical protein
MGPSKAGRHSDLPPGLEDADFIGVVALSCGILEGTHAGTI